MIDEIDANPKKIKEVLTRNVVKILPSREKLASLVRKKKIRLYLGIDPTEPNLHIGHAIALRKLKQFQDLGHEVILLFGDFTAQIGDPSGRDKTRKPLTSEQVRKNMRDYKKQAGKILKLGKLKIKYNHQWLSRLAFSDLIKLFSHFTTSQLLERDMFQRRLKKGKEIWVNELLYPLMQGYDSVAMNVDLEVGATDQTFNMMVGRKLQRIYNKKEKFILTTPMLIGLDGRKMSKTYNNTINLTDSPDEMYGKVMSLKDNLISEYFELCTELPLSEVKKIKQSLKSKKINPRDAKARLAREIVGLYYGKRRASIAEREFNRIFREKKIPSIIPEIRIKEKSINILELLVKTKLAQSKSEAKRLILQGGVKINGKTQKDFQKLVKIKRGMIIQKGKRKFVRIIRF